jgi:hypothetical protein
VSFHLVVVVFLEFCFFFCGFEGGLFLVLGSGFEFVRLLLWLWERFSNMLVAPKPIGCSNEKPKASIKIESKGQNDKGLLMIRLKL